MATREAVMVFSADAFGIAKRDARLTAQEVADALGLSRLTITRWEAGLIAPRPNMVPAIARLLGVDEADLMEAAE